MHTHTHTHIYVFRYYLPPFKACVEQAAPASVMCSLNAVNGVPACANPLLQNTLLREQWGFKGFVLTSL